MKTYTDKRGRKWVKNAWGSYVSDDGCMVAHNKYCKWHWFCIRGAPGQGKGPFEIAEAAMDAAGDSK